MYSLLNEHYEEVLRALKEAIGPRPYFSGTVAVRLGDEECRLVTSVIVYRKRESYPEGDFEPIVDLVPVWWEFHTEGETGEEINDFDFGILRRML